MHIPSSGFFSSNPQVSPPLCRSLTQSLELLHQLVVELPAVFEGDEAVQTLALHLVRPTHYRSLRQGRVLRQSSLHLRCAHQVAWKTHNNRKVIMHNGAML